jgi:F-type H+-transporting ATPase subunit b
MAAEPTSQPADSAAASTGASTEAAQSGGGLPQFKFEFWGGQIVWLLLIFAILYTLLAKVFVPRLRKVLDLRAETIASAVDQAKKVQSEADAQAAAAKAEIEQARAASRALAVEAKTKATAELNKRQAAEDERLAGELAKAEDRIRGLRDAAMTNVSSIAVDTAQAIVERLTGTTATAAELKAAGQGAA